MGALNYANKQYILDKLIKDKDKIDSQISMIKDLKIESVTEEEWHKLCETPLRSNAILLDIAKATFPYGVGFKRHPNEVTFEVDDFTITVPTTLNRGVLIDTKWLDYSLLDGGQCFLKPKNKHCNMRRYFKLIDSNNYYWYDLARARCDIAPNHYSKLSLWLWWYTSAKWKKVDRTEWEQKFEDEDSYNKFLYEKYEKQVLELEKKIEDFYGVVAKLKGWGTVRGYVLKDGLWITTNIDDIGRLTVKK